MKDDAIEVRVRMYPGRVTTLAQGAVSPEEWRMRMPTPLELLSEEIARFRRIYEPTEDERADHSVKCDALSQAVSEEQQDHVVRMLTDDGLGYDLESALSHNDVVLTSAPKRIVLEITGFNDGADWHWIVELAAGGFAYVHGGCDYTGWDCQSSCEAHEAPSFDEVMRLVGQHERMVFEDMIATRQAAREAPAS